MALAGSKCLISKTSRVITHWCATQGAGAAPFSERAVQGSSRVVVEPFRAIASACVPSGSRLDE
jgi:hypothetical protein